jgi:hypothetical protein
MKPMRRLGIIGFGLFLIVATWSLRSPGLGKPIWNVDEAATFTMAEQILRGEVPYRDAVDNRNPLAPFVQAAVFAVTGDWNLRSQHAVLTLMIGLTAVLLWRTARKLGDEAAGVAGALWFTLLCLLLPSVRDTMTAHTAWYLIFFSSVGFWALAHAWEQDQIAWGAASGAAFGLAVLAKQPALLDAGVVVVLLALAAWLQPGFRRARARLALIWLAGFAAPLLLTAGYLLWHGAWADFHYYTWTYYNKLYVPEVPPAQRWATIRIPVILAWQVHPLVVVLGGLAAVGLLTRTLRGALAGPRRFDLVGWLILGWSASGLVSTALSGREFSHYSIQFIPGLSLACGWVTAELWRRGGGWAGSRRGRRVLAACAGAVLGSAVLLRVPARIAELNLPEPGTDTIARLVDRQTTPDERIFVWGYNPEIYAQSRRLPATRFLYCCFLTGLIPWTNLDPLKNTDYAVVPGAWDALLADWERHPPALVADGRSQRGFLKYPLEQQSRLWPLIERDYAEVEAEETHRLGFWMFRRLEATPVQDFPAGTEVGGDIQVRVPPAPPGKSIRVEVSAPPGTSRLDLYLDGRLHRRLACPGAAPITAAFFVLPADRRGHESRLQVLATRASGPTASPVMDVSDAPAENAVGGPPLEFAGRKLAALASSTITGGPILLKKDSPGHWDAHAPSRLVYPWLPGMNSLSFAYGIELPALERPITQGTDGVEVVVEVEEEPGRKTLVFRRYFDREIARRAQGHTVDSTPLPTLPPGREGRIIVQMTPGPRFDIAFDWSYWLWLQAGPSPLALLAGETPRYPFQVETAQPLRQAEFNGRSITVTGAPATIYFPVTPDLKALQGEFGLLDTAWVGRKDAEPVDFILMLARPDGTPVRLFERQLDPARNPDDRGVRTFQVALPQPVNGKLQLLTRTRSGTGSREAFWGGLSATTLDLALHLPNGTIPAGEGSRSDFGFIEAIEEGRACLFAHASSTLIYPWHEGVELLEAEYGLLHGAYTGGNTTDGVVFIVETEDQAGRKNELFRRHLDPTRTPSDRGDQKLRVQIPRVPGGHIILRTAPAPSGRLNNAWSYWRDLRAGPGKPN